MRKNKNERFIKAYNQIRHSKDLDLNEKEILNTILSFKGNNKPCYYSYNEWATILSCSNKTAKRIMNNLKDKGFIVWQSGSNNKSNIYKTTKLVDDTFFNDNENKKFIRSYNQIRYSINIDLSEKEIINTILSFEENNKTCYYPYDKWAIILSCSERTARRTMKKLREKGFINWKTGYNDKSNRYKTTKLVNDTFFNGEFKIIHKNKNQNDNKPKKQQEPSAHTEPLQETKKMPDESKFADDVEFKYVPLNEMKKREPLSYDEFVKTLPKESFETGEKLDDSLFADDFEFEHIPYEKNKPFEKKEKMSDEEFKKTLPKESFETGIKLDDSLFAEDFQFNYVPLHKKSKVRGENDPKPKQKQKKENKKSEYNNSPFAPKSSKQYKEYALLNDTECFKGGI